VLECPGNSFELQQQAGPGAMNCELLLKETDEEKLDDQQEPDYEELLAQSIISEMNIAMADPEAHQVLVNLYIEQRDRWRTADQSSGSKKDGPPDCVLM
jgi:hypothetical protein